MKTKVKKSKKIEKKNIVEIHIYVHKNVPTQQGESNRFFIGDQLDNITLC